MLDCRRWIVACLACGAAANSAPADAPSFDGFVAVPQIWPYPEIMRIAPDRRFLALASDHQIAVIALASGVILRRFNTGESKITGIGISPDSKTIVAGFAQGPQLAWDAETARGLLSVPKGVTLTGRDAHQNSPQPYKLHVTTTPHGGTIEISSDTKSFRAALDEPSCGLGGITPIFDGKYLIYERNPGEGDGLYTPAIALELKDNAFREIWRAPCNDFGHDGGGQLLEEARFLNLQAAFVGPARIWDLKTNHITASFEDADGVVAISKDRHTIVASTLPHENDHVFKVLHEGHASSFPYRMKDLRYLFLSPDGHWLAGEGGGAVQVWSTSDGHQQQDIKGASIGGVTKDGSLTSAPDADAMFHDQQINVQSPNGRWIAVDHDIFDRRDDRRVARVTDGYVAQLYDNGRASIELRVAEAWQLLDLATAKLLWFLELTPDVQGYILTFPDGCIRVAPGSERFVKLVRGFEVLPYDAAAAHAFAEPGCVGSAEPPR